MLITLTKIKVLEEKIETRRYNANSDIHRSNFNSLVKPKVNVGH